MSLGYENIRIAGGDTAKPLAMAKRLAIIQRCLQPQERRFLDCGCGAGEYMLALFERCGLDAQGIEFDEPRFARPTKSPPCASAFSKTIFKPFLSLRTRRDAAMVNEVPRAPSRMSAGP